MPPWIPTTLTASTNSSPSNSARSGGAACASSAIARAARSMALSASQGRAEWPLTPWNVQVAFTLPRQPAWIALAVGSITIATSASRRPGSRSSSGVSEDSGHRQLLAREEAQRRAGRSPGERQLDHHGQRRLHVARAEPVHRLLVSVAGPVVLRGDRVEMPGEHDRTVADEHAAVTGVPGTGNGGQDVLRDRGLVARLRRDVDELERPRREPARQLFVAHAAGLYRCGRALLRDRRGRQALRTAAVHAARAPWTRGDRAGGDLLRAGRRRGRRAHGPRLRRRSGRGDRRAVGTAARPACGRSAAARRARALRPAATSARACATRSSSVVGCRSTRSLLPIRRSRAGSRGWTAASRSSRRCHRSDCSARPPSPGRWLLSATARCASAACARPIPTPSSARCSGTGPARSAHRGGCSSASPRCGCVAWPTTTAASGIARSTSSTRARRHTRPTRWPTGTGSWVGDPREGVIVLPVAQLADRYEKLPPPARAALAHAPAPA